MDNHVAHDELLAYCLGACPDEEHARIDEHLCACGECLRGFLDLKRHVERRGSAERAALRPGDETRARLRASVRAAFRPTAGARLRRTLRRPIPLYQGLAAAAFAALVVLALPMARGLVRAAPGAPSGARVDSARTSPESLDIY